MGGEGWLSGERRWKRSVGKTNIFLMLFPLLWKREESKKKRKKKKGTKNKGAKMREKKNIKLQATRKK